MNRKKDKFKAVETHQSNNETTALQSEDSALDKKIEMAEIAVENQDKNKDGEMIAADKKSEEQSIEETVSLKTEDAKSETLTRSDRSGIALEDKVRKIEKNQNRKKFFAELFTGFGFLMLAFIIIAAALVLGSMFSSKNKAKQTNYTKEQLEAADWSAYNSDELHTMKYIQCVQNAANYYAYQIDWPTDTTLYTFEDYEKDDPDGTIVGTVRVGIPGQKDIQDVYVIFSTDGITDKHYVVAVGNSIYEDDGKMEKRYQSGEGDSSEMNEGDLSGLDLSNLIGMLPERETEEASETEAPAASE